MEAMNELPFAFIRTLLKLNKTYEKLQQKLPNSAIEEQLSLNKISPKDIKIIDFSKLPAKKTSTGAITLLISLFPAVEHINFVNCEEICESGMLCQALIAMLNKMETLKSLDFGKLPLDFDRLKATEFYRRLAYCNCLAIDEDIKKNYVEKIKDLLKDNSLLTQKNDSLQSQMDDLRNEIKVLNGNLQKEKLQSQIDDLKNEIKELKENLQKEKEELKENLQKENEISFIAFGDGNGHVLTNDKQDTVKKLKTKQDIKTTEHWNSGKTDVSSVICELTRPCKLTKLEIAIRSVKYLTVYGFEVNGNKILIIPKFETKIETDAHFSEKNILRLDQIQSQHMISKVEFVLEVGSNISLFWIQIMGK